MNNSVSGKEVRCTSAAQMVKWTNAFKNEVATLISLGYDAEGIPQNTEIDAEAAEILMAELKAFVADESTSQNQFIGEGVTIVNYECSDAQEYYMDGPIINQNRILNTVDEGNKLHQFSGLKVDTNLNTDDVGYAIGTWTHAQTTVEGSKVDGLFVTVKGIGEGANFQLIGQEIDVINGRDPGTEEEYTTAGLQIVTIGTADSTAAIEIVSDWSSAWRHGIMLDEKSISQDGTVLAVGQKAPMKLGIDFSQCNFTDSAIRLNNNQLIRFQADTYDKNGGSMYMTQDNFLVITSGPNGMAIKDNDGIQNLLVIDNNGMVDPNCLFYKNYLQQIEEIKKESRATIAVVLAVAVLMVIWVSRLSLKLRNARILK